MLLLPAVLVLLFATLVLAVRFPETGLLLGVLSLGYIALSATLTLRYVSPAARLSNTWDSRVSGTLSDAIGCNPVVKAFGAEGARGWRARRRAPALGASHAPHLGARHHERQHAGCGDREPAHGRDRRRAASLVAGASRGPGDLAYVLTTIFLVQGYLRDMGQHISNIQRSVNEAEELVALQGERLGIENRDGAAALTVPTGAIRFEHVRFQYGAHANPLFGRSRRGHQPWRAAGPGGAVGLGQDDVHQAAAAALRRERRPHPGGRQPTSRA